MEDNTNAGAMTTILRRFEEHRQEAEDPNRRDWRWSDGTLLFPEGRCCYCGEPVRSNRLWVVDQGWLRGQLDVEKGVFEKPEHPHAGTDGSLCLGDSDSPTDALFFGVNPNDPVMRDMNIPAWYAKMFGHTCHGKDALKSELFPGGGSSYDEEDNGCEYCCHCCSADCCPEDGMCDCGCDDCYCRPPNCFNCSEELGDDDWAEIPIANRHRYFCQKCWSATHTICMHCHVAYPTSEIEEVAGVRYDRYCAQYMRQQARRQQASPPSVEISILDGAITFTAPNRS